MKKNLKGGEIKYSGIIVVQNVNFRNITGKGYFRWLTVSKKRGGMP
jgi:hypothetical protein